MKTYPKWHLYAARNLWTGCVYLGTTTRPDPLDVLERLKPDPDNAMLVRDLRLAGTEAFHLRLVGTFDTHAGAEDAKRESLRVLLAHLGPAGLYNRAGMPSAPPVGPLPPKEVREALTGQLRGGYRPSEKCGAHLSRQAFARQHHSEVDLKVRRAPETRFANVEVYVQREKFRAARLDDIARQERDNRARPEEIPARDAREGRSPASGRGR